MIILLAANPVTIGEPVRGTVHMDAATRWSRLAVILVRRETVDGQSVEHPQELTRVERVATTDSVAVVDFAGPTQGQLPTHRGVRLTIDHWIAVSGEADGQGSVTGRTGIVLRPGPGLPKAANPPAAWTLGPVLGALLVAAAVVLVVLSRAAVDATLAAVVNAAIGIALLTPKFRDWRWGRLTLAWHPARPALESIVTVEAQCSRRRAWTLHRAVVSLEAEEAVDVPNADGHSVERSSILALRQSLFEGERPVGAGEVVSFAATLDLPRDAPPSFRGGSGRVEWQVRLSVDGDAGVREEVQAIIVVPAGGVQFDSEH